MRIVNSLPALDILEEQEPAVQNVVPFRKVDPQPRERYVTCVPLITLRAAAGGFGEVQENILEPADPDVEWVQWDDSPAFSEGMFVAVVSGRSMEPMIPDGSYCLFRRVELPSSLDRAVLVRYSGAADPDTGGHFAVKRYRADGDRVVLSSVNREYEDLVVAGDVRVIGEVVCVVR
jgi:phage repressor protein C with HTH and peptisase S24 domain